MLTAMTQKQLEERKEVSVLKEMMLDFCKSIENIMEEVQDSTPESRTLDGTQMKHKEKMEEEAGWSWEQARK